jgi:hypothetical protein
MGALRDLRPFGPELGTAVSNFVPQFSRNLHVFIDFTYIQGKKRLTSLFSSTHPEHFFWPFAFNNSSRAIFIFNIFFASPLCFQQLIQTTFLPLDSLRVSAPFRTLTRGSVICHNGRRLESSILRMSKEFPSWGALHAAIFPGYRPRPFRSASGSWRSKYSIFVILFVK